MKKTIVVLMVISLGLASIFAFAEEKKPDEVSRCGKCHGIPPGVDDAHQPSNPGAHIVHLELGCDSCHAEGDKAGHVNGTISILPDVGYEFGTAIPWPGQGGGSCGGEQNPPMPGGCHTEMAEKTCLWIPGKNCKSPGDP